MKNSGGQMDAILIAGPTASGKSALALDLADRIGGVIVNADSMQVYSALHLLTARPSQADTDQVEHRLYGHRPADQAYSTGEWMREAAEVIADVQNRGQVPIIVGGTGLYFEALLGGLATMPDIPEPVRTARRAELQTNGPAAMHGELARKDPETAARLSPNDGQRIARALEVLDATGKSISVLQAARGEPVLEAANTRRILLMPERDVLTGRIDRRFKQMVAGGALDEVRGLLDLHLDPSMPAMKAIGVPELAAHLNGNLDLENAIDQGAAATRRYAKRQMTWFRNRFSEDWHRISSPTLSNVDLQLILRQPTAGSL